MGGGVWFFRKRGVQRVSRDRGLHKSTLAQISFLLEYFNSTVEKGQWVVLSYSVAKEIQWLRPYIGIIG